MKQPVTIKANNFGLLIFLDAEMDFLELKKLVGEKFQESKDFFGSSSMAVSFEDRVLTGEEEGELVDEILRNSNIKISCVIDKDPIKEKMFMEHLQKYEQMNDTGITRIYKGNFRSGKMMEFDTGVIIFGDVNPGAKVRAKGNVIILGSLKGEAEAGTDGNDNTFIVALDMHPIQLRIGTKIARCSDDNRMGQNDKTLNPQIAFVENGNIYIEKLDKSTLDTLNLTD